MDAVLAASPVDELDWIEWKSTPRPRVTGPCGEFLPATSWAWRTGRRTVLAANAGGQGFVVVGAEPGRRCGVEAADPADLSQGIEAFLGPELGPLWTMHYDDRDGLLVLVVTVAAPRPGRPHVHPSQATPGGVARAANRRSTCGEPFSCATQAG